MLKATSTDTFLKKLVLLSYLIMTFQNDIMLFVETSVFAVCNIPKNKETKEVTKMKQKIIVKLSAFAIVFATLLSLGVQFCISAESTCFHETQKGLVETESGYTIANVCTKCGKAVSVIGYVKNDTPIKVYSDSGKTSEYSGASLVNGFERAAAKKLYVDNGVISKSGVPYWFTFDLTINNIPTLASGDLSVISNRASRGWSIVALAQNTTTATYDTVLRILPDNWDPESGANGTQAGTDDGSSPIKPYADNNGFRNAKTVIVANEGDTVSFALRIDPTNGSYDIYVDNKFIMTTKIVTRDTDAQPYIRLWEEDGNNGDFDFSNIAIFADNYTEETHKHTPQELIHFFDNGYTKYSSCDCGERILLEERGFASVIANDISHVYNGGEGKFTFRASDYWFVTDVNIRGMIGDGTLVKLSDTVVLEVKNGIIVTGNTQLAAVSFPTSYQVAVNIKSGTDYDLYFNGFKVASGALTSNDYRVYLGCSEFGYHVRFTYNRAVTLSETESSAVTVTYDENETVKRCYHENSGEADNKYVREANGVVTHSYICTMCGERVYAKLTNSLASYDNDELFGYMPNALLKSDFNSVTTAEAKVLYLENGLIGRSASPYCISFNLTPNSLPVYDETTLDDPNSTSRRGYNLVSAEASFHPTSELRVVPTSDGAEIRILNQDVRSNKIDYDTAIATLSVGNTVNVILYIDPANGEYDVYIDGEYKGSSKTTGLEDFEPQIRFHDNGAGEFVFSNISVATEARNLADSVNAFEIEAAYIADKTKPAGYTSLASITRTTSNASYRYDLLFVNNRTGELCFKDAKDNYHILTDKDGKAHKLSKAATSIIAVYDDVRATVRYYVDGKVPYYDGDNAMNITVNSDFANASAICDRLITDTSIVSKAKIHGMEASGVMQVIALQQRIKDDALRIVSGLDIPWYGSAGYKVTLYDANGKALGDETSRESTVVFNEIQADNEMIPATKYGYTYFVPLEIKCNGTINEHAGEYFMVTPYVAIGSAVLEGEQVKITITKNGYEFTN